ncbi:MAG: SDR family oxidoreductase [Bryobacteraceae bacterium]
MTNNSANTFLLKGKIAVVTGGTKGIGKAIAGAIVSAGGSVAICARSQTEITATVSALDPRSRGIARGKVVDLRDSDAVSEFFQFVDSEFGGIDILVNNAGIGIFRSVRDFTVADWNTTLETNLNAVFYCCHEALPRMIQRGGGSIINISSLAGRNPFAGGAAYNASKFALNGFSEALMLDHRKDNIRVTYVMPGSVDTGFGSNTEPASWKIAPEDVAQVVMDVLAMPERTLISRVEMRPSRPAK